MSETPSDGSPGDGRPREGQPAGEQPSEPTNERLSDWRSDGSPGRFTEPPSRPSAGTADKAAADKAAGDKTAGDKTAGDRQGKPGDRQGKTDSGRPGKPSGSRPGKPSGDPAADFQRWLMKAGARSMANQVADNVRRTLRQPKRDSGDVWDTATTEQPLDEPPECQWCPVCQAARRMRVSGPGLSDRLASAGGVLASVVQDAFSAVEQVMKTPPPEDGERDKAS